LHTVTNKKNKKSILFILLEERDFLRENKNQNWQKYQEGVRNFPYKALSIMGGATALQKFE
jgi:hypothetical protein